MAKRRSTDDYSSYSGPIGTYPITTATSLDVVNQLYDKIFAQLEKNAYNLKRRLERISGEADDIKDAVYHQAYVEAQKYIDKVAFDIIAAEIHRACASTKEYNYDLFLNRLIAAAAINLEEGKLLVMVPESNGTITIGVNGNALGDISIYAQRVRDVREKHYSDRKKVGPEPGIEMRSKFWKEKVYGPGREGRPVYRRRYNRKKRTYRRYNATELYKDKYRQIIEERLSGIPENLAPFWQLIDQGNASLSDSDGGEAYPTNKPTNFIGAIRDKIAFVFETGYERFKGTARAHYNKLVMQSITNKAANIAGDLTEIIENSGTVVYGTLSLDDPTNFTLADESKVSELEQQIEKDEITYTSYMMRGRMHTATLKNGKMIKVEKW